MAKVPGVLVAKPDLDGHDRGARAVAHALKDSGYEVIYTGLHQTVEMTGERAIQEDAEVIGFSMMSGAHVPITRELFDLLAARGIGDTMMVVGGVILSRGIMKLKDVGVAEVFPSGSDIDASASFTREKLICRLSGLRIPGRGKHDSGIVLRCGHPRERH